MLCLFVLASALLSLISQPALTPSQPPHPMVTELPPAPPARTYISRRVPAGARVEINGDITKPVWNDAAWTDDFVDIEGDLKPAPAFRTRVKMMWDDDNLYFAAQLEEPHVWATLTERDSVVFHDNDFEVFLNPSCDTKNYYELEVNALNTVWDLLLRKPYREGGKGDNSFNIVGLKTAVKVHGTINDPRDTDTGWDVEVAIPFKALNMHTHHPGPPKDGDAWKINFSRVEWDTNIVSPPVSGPHSIPAYVKVEGAKEHNWVWSPMGLIDMHLPDRWGSLVFRK
ncbi:MAG TPA: carbohydrate-binding family 9-like protein [Phycisphaerales bacterium]|nr:carbohydrate-binding family 9-like protein [Phycisphaerales bacterium]